MDYKSRVEKLKQTINWQKYDAVLISSNPTVIYFTGYTNFSPDERDAYLLITDKNEYLITDSRFSEAVYRDVSHFTVLERSQKNPFADILNVLKSEEQIRVVGIEEDHLTVSEYKFFRKHLGKLKNVDVTDLRMIKSPEEIANIKKACELGDRAVDHIKKLITEKTSEIDLALEFELFLKKEQSEPSFPTIVAFSKNSSVPHHQTGKDKLHKKSGQFVLVDSGAKYEGYCSDMTRTFFFGEPSDEQKKIYNTVLVSQQKAVDLINEKLRQGKPIFPKDIDAAAAEYIELQGYKPYNHALGHGIGLEVHEKPVIARRFKEPLQEGMVFSIEPGVYIPDFGGVRIEDLYVIENNKLKQLTSFSREITIIG